MAAEVRISDRGEHDEVDGALKEQLHGLFEAEEGSGILAGSQRSELHQKIEIAVTWIESATQGRAEEFEALDMEPLAKSRQFRLVPGNLRSNRAVGCFGDAGRRHIPMITRTWFTGTTRRGG